MYGVNTVLFIAIMVIIFPNRDNFRLKVLSVEQCQQVVAFAILYEFLILSYTVRIAASCYMSIKQCRSIKDCNREFICVLNASLNEVQ